MEAAQDRSNSLPHQAATIVVLELYISTRVSSAKNRKNLDSQAERLCQYSAAKGYQIVHIVKEVGSGLNDELMTDLVSIITIFSARLYGYRRAKHKIEAIISTLRDA